MTNNVPSFPFGNPDGSRSSIEDIMKSFVDFSNYTFGFSGLNLDKSITTRVIVGAKGSGKTVYLRRIHAIVSDNDSVYCDKIQQELPSTHDIVKFCHCFAENELTESWEKLWYCAIVRSLVSHIINVPELSNNVSEDNLEKLKKIYLTIDTLQSTPVSIYSQVSAIIYQFNTSHQFNNYFANPQWNNLDWLLSEIMSTLPPVFFFIDSVDEEYSHAPTYWLRCQKGLFYRVMRFLRDSKLGGKLHIVIAIRDHVLASIYRSEHKTRYMGEPHIKVLRWGFNEINYFLQKKIENLPDSLFLGDIREKGKNLETLLGRNSVNNKARSIHENINKYVIRHTRKLPRDIIIVGNKLCELAYSCKVEGKSKVSDAAIRSTMNSLAKQFGDDQLRICANNISSCDIPECAGRKGFSEIYTGNDEFSNIPEEIHYKLIDLFTNIAKERLDGEEFKQQRDYSKKIFGDKSDVFSIMWQNGILGYIEAIPNPRTIFFQDGEIDEYIIPHNKSEYVFHSTMINSTGIKSVGKKPVI